MAWRLVKSLQVLRKQIDAAYPKRSKHSDGTIGDEAHQARVSDHNPERDGTVDAIDLTHSPESGFHAGILAETLRRTRDPRLKYVIWNRQIFSATVKPWVWRPASGHTQHIHISVNDWNQDDPSPWDLGRGGPFRHKDIIATTFSSKESGKRGAYGHLIDNKILGVALPASFKRDKLPKVRLFYKGKELVVPVVDKGPWNIDDDAYVSGEARPQAESGKDTRGRKTNKAGIDLTPATARALGLPEQWLGKLDWEFA